VEIVALSLQILWGESESVSARHNRFALTTFNTTSFFSLQYYISPFLIERILTIVLSVLQAGENST